MSRWVAGVDGWRGRWVAAYLENGALETVRVHESLPALEADDLWSELAAVGVDAPIGLPHGAERRAADLAARAFIGPQRAASVFFAPPQELLDAGDAIAAREIATRNGWKGISAQTRALAVAIRQAAASAQRDARVHEVHPEVSFRAMRGGTLRWSKRTWNGFHERRQLLLAHGIVIPEQLGGAAGAVKLDDVVDACAAAWSADRIALGTAARLPAENEQPPVPAIYY